SPLILRPRTLRVSPSALTSVEWDSVGKRLASFSQGGTLRIVSYPEGRLLLARHYGRRATQARLRPDWRRVAVRYESGNVRVTDLESKAVVRLLRRPTPHGWLGNEEAMEWR